ncbi:hypothetical protein C8R43DRAFT_1125334 [Mycena crocata]|nr:hypothetical protein C8R43DRAFT_1125334 [Mycena crocata]
MHDDSPLTTGTTPKIQRTVLQRQLILLQRRQEQAQLDEEGRNRLQRALALRHNSNGSTPTQAAAGMIDPADSTAASPVVVSMDANFSLSRRPPSDLQSGEPLDLWSYRNFLALCRSPRTAISYDIACQYDRNLSIRCRACPDPGANLPAAWSGPPAESDESSEDNE